MHFSAASVQPSEGERTKGAPFHLVGGGQVTAPIMRQGGSLGYAEGARYQVVELPHSGKVFVSADEVGTEVAAATAAMMRLLAAPEEPVEVSADRPFLVLMRDVETGITLFIGRVPDRTT